MEFKEAIEHILIFEGGYVNDPNDSGGETKYGISKRAYPNLKILELTKEQAKEIYFNDYWKKAKCDKIPSDIRLIHFDTAVNMGVNRANKILQKIIGVTSDGIIGNVTLKYVHKATLSDYAVKRLRFYVKIIINKPTQLKYVNGWFKRVIKTIQLC